MCAPHAAVSGERGRKGSPPHARTHTCILGGLLLFNCHKLSYQCGRERHLRKYFEVHLLRARLLENSLLCEQLPLRAYFYFSHYFGSLPVLDGGHSKLANFEILNHSDAGDKSNDKDCC